MRRLTLILAGVAGVTLMQASLADNTGIPTSPPAIVIPAPAVASARAWLGLVDQGNSSQSWDQSNVYFQAQVSLPQRTNTMKQVRGTFGHVIARSFVHGELAGSLPKAPAGRYAVLHFKTDASRHWARETVTVKWQDGAWKVAGFYVNGPNGVYVSGGGALPMQRD